VPEVRQATLQELIRKQALMRYPVLTDVKNGIVSQAEHSAIVTKNGAMVYTRD
jgi:methionine aminopeptidase